MWKLLSPPTWAQIIQQETVKIKTKIGAANWAIWDSIGHDQRGI